MWTNFFWEDRINVLVVLRRVLRTIGSVESNGWSVEHCPDMHDRRLWAHGHVATCGQVEQGSDIAKSALQIDQPLVRDR